MPDSRDARSAAKAIEELADAAALQHLADDPRYIGARLAASPSSTHTWTRALRYHQHVHLIVTATDCVMAPRDTNP
jgi:hypothetical protein